MLKNHNRKSILVFLIAFSFILAQSGSVSGTVSDENGNGLPGANLVLNGTSLGAATDSDGAYQVNNVPSGSYTITATYIGYQSASQSVTVGDGGATANFSLEVDAVAMGDILVTGTRTAGRTAMKSSTPIDGFDDVQLRRQGNGDMTETLKNTVPSFNATPLTGDGAAFVRPTSMRGLPPDNILVLTNSKRRHRSSLISHFGAAMNVGAQAVDVGMIPSIAIKRLEVLRDGAAAQYGSDAIAGVMNFLLKDNNSGFEIHATNGRWMTAENGRGGETDVTLALNKGMKLTDNGFFNVSAEYSSRPELSRGFQHASASDGYKGWNKSKDKTNSDGKYIGTQDVDSWQTAMNWGRPENNGFRSVWNAGLKISDNIEAYSFGNYADTFGEYSFFLRAAGKSGALTAIPLDPADPSKGNFSWGDTYPMGFTPRLEGHGNDFSSVTGVRGSMANGMNYDFSASYGSNHLRYNLKNSLNLSWGPYSPHNFDIGDLEQAESNLNADFTYPINDAMNLGFGTEWREEKYTMFEGQKESWMPGPWGDSALLIDPVTGKNYTAPGLAANGMPGTSPDGAGVFARTNTAFYADLEYDMDALLVQFAARSENFSDFGGTFNYKAAARYSLGNLVSFRGSVSTGFRAPTPGQSNYTGVVTSFDGPTGKQVQEGTVRSTNPLAVALGGKELGPEKANNMSFGFTSNPMSNLNLTFDYYTIDIEDKILKSRSLAVEGNPYFKKLAFYTNALDTKTTGYDLVAVYKMGKTNFGLALNHNETKVQKQKQVNGIDPVSEGNVMNLEENLPKDRMVLTVDHKIRTNMTAMVRMNYYGESIDERSQKDVIKPISFFDVELNYFVSNNLSIVFGANNVTNAFPNQIATRMSQGMPYPRRSPLGYHGGMTYMRLMYNF